MKRLRWRLLVQHLVVTGLILAGAEAALFVLVRWSGRHELETALRKEVEKVASFVVLEPDLAEVNERRAQEVRLGSAPVSWQVLLPGGAILGQSRDLATGRSVLPSVGEAAAPPESLRIGFGRWPDLGGAAVARVLTNRKRLEKRGRPVRMPPELLFEVRAASSSAPLDETLRKLALFLVAGFPVGLGIAGFAAMRLIRSALRPMEAAFERERRFTGAVSHELRTPLAGLRGDVEVTLRRERSTAEYVEALRRVGGGAERMTKIVEGLLVLARAEAGHLLVGADQVSAHELVACARELVAPLPGSERVEWRERVGDGAVAAGDRVLLAQALRNLVENALIHGTAPISVEVTNPTGALCVAVADRGRGFPAALLAPEPRAAAAPSRFGLRIARSIVEAHGGRLTLTNPPEGGARATAALPARATTASATM
jgi:signal transduction histidine kinase